MTYKRKRIAHAAATLISLLLMVGVLIPAIARASMLSSILASIKLNLAAADETPAPAGNVQTMALLRPATNIDPRPNTGGGDITVVDDTALMPEEGPSGTIADIEKPKNPTISVYIVREGDTLSSIAKLFDVSSNTILWANDLTASSRLSVGEQLIILPVTGVRYTVKKGDTLDTIAKRYGGSAADIATFNGIDNASLAVGMTVIVPDGEVGASGSGSGGTGGKTVVTISASCGRTIPLAGNPNEPSHNVGPVGSCAQISYYRAPLSHYIQTQGIHGYNAVDLAAPSGAPIMAAADGTVIVARAGGYNGGYGSYVVIQHPNGSQTLYGHMSRVAAYDGEHVAQGQMIGAVGTTGASTGPHLHFEIRGGIRNPF